MHIGQPPTHTLELRIQTLPQLFNSLDPTPFLNRDMDRDCEAYIENWALSLPHDSHLHLKIHVDALAPGQNAAADVADAVHNYFGYKCALARGQLQQLMRQGRTSLAIGLSFVTFCLLLAEALNGVLPGSSAKIARESLTIVGWVAMWRPIQIFLYDWWPVTGYIKTLENIRFAQVQVVAAARVAVNAPAPA